MFFCKEKRHTLKYFTLSPNIIDITMFLWMIVHFSIIYVFGSIIDIGTYVKNAKVALAKEFRVPAGYSIVWSGQFEYMERANKKLRVVIPITLLIIFY